QPRAEDRLGGMQHERQGAPIERFDRGDVKVAGVEIERAAARRSERQGRRGGEHLALEDGARPERERPGGWPGMLRVRNGDAAGTAAAYSTGRAQNTSGHHGAIADANSRSAAWKAAGSPCTRSARASRDADAPPRYSAPSMARDIRSSGARVDAVQRAAPPSTVSSQHASSIARRNAPSLA